ncbi:hypothetical protein RJ55_06136 [Drechmeria coniospora]|nr:hypothetical protein RJ55_06136 [Drechmeria coniospora]
MSRQDGLPPAASCCATEVEEVPLQARVRISLYDFYKLNQYSLSMIMQANQPDANDRRASHEALKRLFPFHVQRTCQYSPGWSMFREANSDVVACVRDTPRGMIRSPAVCRELDILHWQTVHFARLEESARRDANHDSYYLSSWTRGHCLRAWSAAILKARREETYWRFIVELRKLEFENLYARYTTDYYDNPRRANASWSPLTRHVSTILAEVRREIVTYRAWREAIETGADIPGMDRNRPPPRRWNRLLLKVSEHAECCKASTTPWTFRRIMRVLQDCHDRKWAYRDAHLYMSRRNMSHFDCAIRKAIFLARDSVVDDRLPDNPQRDEVAAVKRANKFLCASLLERIVRRPDGSLLGCWFRSPTHGKDAEFGHHDALRSVEAEDEWNAVPRVRVLNGVIKKLQHVEDGARAEGKLIAVRWSYDGGDQSAGELAEEEEAVVEEVVEEEGPWCAMMENGRKQASSGHPEDGDRHRAPLGTRRIDGRDEEEDVPRWEEGYESSGYMSSEMSEVDEFQVWALRGDEQAEPDSEEMTESGDDTYYSISSSSSSSESNHDADTGDDDGNSPSVDQSGNLAHDNGDDGSSWDGDDENDSEAE